LHRVAGFEVGEPPFYGTTSLLVSGLGFRRRHPRLQFLDVLFVFLAAHRANT
jgi:hypothetical protein